MQILVTELGDETFIIAAIMAMRHPRLTVYAGAMSALAFMTVRPLPVSSYPVCRALIPDCVAPGSIPQCAPCCLSGMPANSPPQPQDGRKDLAERLFGFLQVISTALGYVLPNLISRKATQHAASVLYTFFGLRLLYIAWYSKPQESNQVGCMLKPRHMQSCMCSLDKACQKLSGVADATTVLPWT